MFPSSLAIGSNQTFKYTCAPTFTQDLTVHSYVDEMDFDIGFRN